MATLYVRDVPDHVTEILKERAAETGQSLSAYITSQLTTLAARPSGTEVAARLASIERPQGISRNDILDALHSSRR